MLNQSRWIKRAQFVGLVVILLFVVLLSAAGGSLFTVSAAPLAATSPTLGAASTFAVLAGAGISDVPTSAITGDVGNPAGASITGLTCAEVTGTIYDADGGYVVPHACGTTDATLLNNAQIANTAAFGALDTGANATCTVNYGNVVTSLNGLSLGPGVYCTDVTGTTGAFTLSGTLTLTGSGVWIFRSGSTLTTSGPAKIVGGDPCNVWWRVPADQAGAATLGTNTSFIGNILTLKGIVMQTGASLNGRALAQIGGAVTLDHNTITRPTCAPTPTRTRTPTRTPLPATQTAVAATQTLIAVINTATAIALLPTRTPGPGGNQATSTPRPGGNQATSAPTEILGATATSTQVVNTLLPTTGGSGSDGLTLLWLAVGVAGAALLGFPLLLRRRR